jgi:transcription elongation factor SPT6
MNMIEDWNEQGIWKVYDLFVLFRLRAVQTTEELKDVHTHFLLYYSHEVPEMQKAWRVKEREAAREARKNSRKRQVNAEGDEGDGEHPEGYDAQDEENETEVEDEPPENEIVKQAVRSGPYSMCKKAGLGESIPPDKLHP